MPELQLLRLDHADMILAFERENRAYFAASVPDRGDDYFDNFRERLDKLLAEQEVRAGYFHLLLGVDGELLGRITLVDVEQGTAQLGYRIAQRVAGHEFATHRSR